ncbi:MAG: DNA-processing protein DprA [Rikenellaceae bacterium]
MDIFDIALAFTPRVGSGAAAHLIEVFGSAQRIFAASVGELVARAELNRRVAESIVSRVAMVEAERELEYCRRHGIEILAATDNNYPFLLKQMPDPPHIIFANGNLEALKGTTISIVGTRKNTPYGERSCKAIVKDLASKIDDLVVVSGLAFGTDASAHRAALEVGAKTIAVLPNPLPDVSPASHRTLADAILDSGGLLLSEQRSTVKNISKTFISRNRIIAALSEATIVMESGYKGGSMSTARAAADFGRSVFALPGRITDPMSSGCNSLISSCVAQSITAPDHLIFMLGWEGRVSTSARGESDDADGAGEVITFDETQRGVLGCFRYDEPLHVSQIEELSQLSTAELNGLLMELELMGAVATLPGSRYERTIPHDKIG